MKSWSLNAKFALILVILTAVAIVIAYDGLYNMDRINARLRRVSDVVATRALLAVEVGSQIRYMTVHLKDHVLAKDPTRMAVFSKRMDDEYEKTLKNLDMFLNLADEDAKPKIKKYRDDFVAWVEITKEIRSLSLDGQKTEALKISLGKGEPARAAVVAAGNELAELNQTKMQNEAKMAVEDYQKAKTQMLLISVIGIFSGLALALLVLRALSRTIDHLIHALDDSSSQVTSAAQQIASSSEELSQAATEQASSLEETAASVEEMNAMVQKNAENARKSAEVSAESNESATRGQQVVKEMIKAIDEINDSNKEIVEIVKVISEIESKTKIINDIVFQTKLLSFNASVEAARAGEHGKGFAVVAEEVGNLAQMSGNAAKEISTLLGGSIEKVSRIVDGTKTKVESSTQVAQQCGAVLEEIVGNVLKVTDMVGEISTACQEQAQGVQEITKAINQLDQVTQTNASTSEEAASAAEELSAQSDSLRSMVNLLVETIKGRRGNSAVIQPSTSHKPAASATKKASVQTNVVKTIPFRSQHKVSVHPPLKKASGYENGTIPSENDPRFEEV